MLVDRLLKTSHEKKVLVYAITGMGGIGKTTLAWKIFNHEMIQSSFNQIRPAWVCISKAYEQTTVLKKIIMAFKGGRDEIQSSDDELPNKLRQLVTGKKFFLVLDDVWSIEVWDEVLKPLLPDAGPGSRILITTRNTAISKGMDAERCHAVQKLSSEDSWSLLCKMVFRGGGDERLKQNLKHIGMRIVDKCDGLPLALKTIGTVLRGRDLIQAEWEKVAGDSTWWFEQQGDIEGIGKQLMTEVLYPSYEDLSSQLRLCFVYCAMFPKDCILRKDMLVPLWIAEGFIKASKDSSVEDTAGEYWKQLERRCLLQPDPGRYDQGGFKMHPVVRSLALYLAQDECYSGDVRGLRENQTADVTSSSPKRRRVLIKDAEGVSIPEVMKEPTCLRTIIFLDTPPLQEVAENFFEKFTCLRVLDLSEAPNSKLPDAVQNLIHLRYLNLSRSQMSELPNTIGTLRSLQFLGLAECTMLRILSDAILELRNLRVLDVDGTQLEGMPKGIGKLQHLNRLVGFRVNSSTNNADISGAEGGERQNGRQRSPASWCNLEELKSLTQLKFLAVQNLESISSIDEAERAELSSKSRLDDLRLICNPAQEIITDEEKRKIKEVFTKLRPPTRLQRLQIGRYFGLEYPGWMMGGGIGSHLSDLKHLELSDCFFCQTLPPLGLLPQLETLHISGANAVKRIGNEFLLGDAAAAAAGQAQHRFRAFPELKYLALKKMNSWQEWWWKGEEEDQALLPRLEELVIERCGKLMSLPKHLLRNVTRLTIEDAYNVTEIGNLPSVRTLMIARSGLGRIHNLLALDELTIVDCFHLRRMEKIGELRYLKLQDQKMRSLPNWLRNNMEGQEQLHSLTYEGFKSMFASSDRQDFVAARKFEFICSGRLLQRCIKDAPESEWPKIQDIPYVEGYTMDKSKYILYDKSNPDHNFHTNINKEEITNETTTNSSSDLASPFSIVILLLLIIGVTKLAFDYKSFLLPLLMKAAAAIQKFKYTRLCDEIYSLYHAWQKQ
uniref:Disease resistance RPP13-like protein 1 n=1 Tax=Elaeis guineensis var. tenera TaxID=51953 RepID=A0A8N4F905_ELAGV|nr:putative disease resistance RPP13-like protein 1 [Elaeis guineensis]